MRSPRPDGRRHGAAVVTTLLILASAACSGGRPPDWLRRERPASATVETEPVVAATEEAAPASRLLAVRVASEAEAEVITLVGDGEFRYREFSLTQPHRFVIDLEGVWLAEELADELPGVGTVLRVRLGQFTREPEPVTRVVLDLGGAVDARLESTPEALRVILSAPTWRGVQPPG